MKTKKAIIAVSALLALSLLVGSLYAGFKVSSAQNISEPGVKEFSIKITHAGGYSPDTFTVNKGDKVRFLATSDPAFHLHGITIDEFGVNTTVYAASTPQVIEFVANKSGTFEIWCQMCLDGPLGDHPWMKGKLVVT